MRATCAKPASPLAENVFSPNQSGKLGTAKRALKAGGACYTVCKNAAGLEPVQRRYFPDVEIIKRRGYAVLKSVKN